MARGVTVRLYAPNIGDAVFWPHVVDAITELAARLHAEAGANKRGSLNLNPGDEDEVRISWVVHNDLPEQHEMFTGRRSGEVVVMTPGEAMSKLAAATMSAVDFK